MIIKRDIYLNKLIDSMNYGLIKVITGIRRCGKSFLLFNLFDEYLRNNNISDPHIIKIALDDRTNKKLRDPDELLKHIRERILDNEIHYILLDEIQIKGLQKQ